MITILSINPQGYYSLLCKMNVIFSEVTGDSENFSDFKRDVAVLICGSWR